MIDNAFNALKGISMRVEKTPCIIMACCVLHNFCELHGIPKHVVQMLGSEVTHSLVLIICIVLKKKNKQKQLVNS
jgi:Na+-translocating ferredoxin:NAD+ oxidoreductase RnfA subunit